MGTNDTRRPKAQSTYTVVETARLIGISRNSAYAAAREGKLPVIRIGRRILVPRAALERLLAEPQY